MTSKSHSQSSDWHASCYTAVSVIDNVGILLAIVVHLMLAPTIEESDTRASQSSNPITIRRLREGVTVAKMLLLVVGVHIIEPCEKTLDLFLELLHRERLDLGSVVFKHDLEEECTDLTLFVPIVHFCELHTEFVPCELRNEELRLQLIHTISGARSRLSNLERIDALTHADHFESIGLDFLTPEHGREHEPWS